MTTIKSMYDKKLDITHSPDFPGWVRIKCEDGSALHAAGHHESRLYTTADLAAALGLVTREELDRKQAAWENECGNLEMTQRERDAFKAELSESRKDTRNAEMHSETYRVKYEVAEAARAMLDRTARELRAKLDEAEATIARVRHLRDVSGDTVGVEELDAALDPKPAFVLPTEAGLVIEYTDHDGGRQRWFRTRDTQRPWVDREGNTWHDAGVERDVASDFTVLIGAES